MSSISYTARQFDLSNLRGISDETLEMHFKLYEGYVKETNKLNEKISEFVKGGKVDQDEFAEYSELNRRLGFEFNGMVLHEYYFDNLKKGGGTGDPNRTSAFRKAAEQSFGSYDIWKAEFVGIGKMRGVGWAICYENPCTESWRSRWRLDFGVRRQSEARRRSVGFVRITENSIQSGVALRLPPHSRINWAGLVPCPLFVISDEAKY